MGTSWKPIAVTLVALALGHSAWGQEFPPPLLLTVTPLGSQVGTSVEVTVTGQNLDTTEGLYFSVSGVKAELVRPPEPEKKPDKSKKTDKKPPPKAMAPQNTFKFNVTISEGARLGIHDLRVVTKGGISNPRAFVVGDLKEISEAEPNDDVPQAKRIELNTTVNGVIAAPTDVDYFVFAGKKGERIVLSCLTTSIDSKLPANVELYGPAGNYLGSGRGYQENDALLDATLTEDGDYHVRVSSFTYTLGGADYFYRLTVSTAPWIDAVYPPVVAPGKTTQVTVFGRNLPGGKPAPDAKVGGRGLEMVTVPVKAPADAQALSRLDFTGFVSPRASSLDGFELRLRNEAGASNPYLLDYATAPVIVDNEKNDSPETAQQVAVPCEIVGRIEKKGDSDWFVFSAKKGDVYSIEGWADRLGVPMDLFFLLRNAKGQTIAEQDDVQEILTPQFVTRTFDPPRYRLVVPADGEYQLQVGSRDSFVEAGPRHIYRLRIAPEKPDFRLVAMPLGTQTPEAPVLGQNGNEVINVLAWRLDGFNGDITLTADKVPPGMTMKPQVLPAGQKQVPIVLSAGPSAAPWTGSIRILGTATVGGEKLVREVRSATMTWPVAQANLPAVSRLDRSLALAIRDQAPLSLSVGKEQFVAQAGGKIAIPVKVTRYSANAKAALQLTALNLPQALVFPKNLSLAANQDSGEAILNVQNNAQPGKYSLVLRAQTGTPGKQPPKGPKGQKLVTQSSPPISILILPKQVAKLSVPNNVKITAGQKTPVTINVGRLFNYDGAFDVKLVLPPDAKGIQATATQIGEDKNEGSVTLTAAADAPPGTRANLVVRATAMFHGTAIVQEAKFNLTVVKGK